MLAAHGVGTEDVVGNLVCLRNVLGEQLPGGMGKAIDLYVEAALKYDGLPALAGLSAPNELYIHNHRGTGAGRWLREAYVAAKAEDKLQRASDKQPTDKVIEWLLR